MVAAIAASGGRAAAIQGDVATAPDVERLFKNAMGTFGDIHVVVNCAGIMPLRPIADGDTEVFDRAIATNLRGTFLVLAQAAQHVVSGGRIIAFSTSVIAKIVSHVLAVHRLEGGRRGTGVCAGQRAARAQRHGQCRRAGTRCDGAVPDGQDRQQIDQLRRLPPLERLGEPDDIAGVVSFLAGPDGGWVNAQVLRANGGFA